MSEKKVGVLWMEQDTIGIEKFANLTNVTWMRHVLMSASKEGTLCCLPNDKGEVDTQAAYNPVTGHIFSGLNQIMAKQFMREHKYKKGEFISFEQMKAAGTYPRGKGLSIVSKDRQTNEIRCTRYFNTEQAADIQKVKQLVKINEEKRAAYQEKKMEHEGKSHRKEKGVITEIRCTTTDASGYLGEYLAAVSCGARFTVSHAQAQEFVKNFTDSVYARNAQGHTNPFQLTKIAQQAQTVCKKTLAVAAQQTRKQVSSARER